MGLMPKCAARSQKFGAQIMVKIISKIIVIPVIQYYIRPNFTTKWK